MSLVLGENVAVYIYDGGLWKPYACGRSCTLSVDTEILETSVKGSGKFATFIASKNSFSGSIDGLVNLELVNHLSLHDLRQRQLAHEVLLMRFEREDADGNTYVDEGQFIITNSSDTGAYADMNTFSIELQGTGALTQSFTPTPIDPNGKVKRYDYTGTGGETSFNDALLISKDILEVVKDGIGFAEIVAGTPNDKEAKYTPASGTIEFAMAFETGEKAYVLYQDI